MFADPTGRGSSSPSRRASRSARTQPPAISPASSACFVGAPAVARDRPGLELLEDAGLGPRVGEEADPLRVRATRTPGRPRSAGSVSRRGLPAARRDDPEARELLADAGAVEAPVEVGDPPRGRLLRIADAEPLLAALGEDGDALSRPATTRRRRPGRRTPRAGAARRRRAAGARAATSRSGSRGRGASVPSGEKRGRMSMSPVVICSARPPLSGHAPEPRPVLAALDRPPAVDDRRAVGRDRELRSGTSRGERPSE